ncbi:MAG: heparinase II/III family protein [Gemmatimonadaceae bacterium]|nr:heparinase II/III family protein [Gemmatimonadaceae bacterium]
MLLLSASAFHDRRRIASGTLAPLADGLRAELQPVVTGALEVPHEKAMLSRRGGRCARDGTLLDFDPFDPRHRCPRCGTEFTGEEHDRFRLYWYQLWLAERTLHAAMLGALGVEPAGVSVAAALLEQYAERYLRYPNADNVLGPSRPFFSTYLESIWLLQIILATELVETAGAGALAGRVRDRVIAPSARLIASYDEGMSNRQVWNVAALLAAWSMLGDSASFEAVVHGASGVRALLSSALLPDGSWYEGENYHLFAHRGLWYAVHLTERGGISLTDDERRRFHDGFASPFRTVMPDLTYPSRRDSQFRVSVRQPRFAESCELGLARTDDVRLTAVLARLYDRAVARGETGRRGASADVERNVAATGLSRADLSWRSLLFARETLPPLAAATMRSELLPSQGFGVLRRRAGQLYASLDYGHSGGGHGHPDRLNVILANGDDRLFDDPGTGSYVDPSLHWYRSTLAHFAPLVDGCTQSSVHGALLAQQDGDIASWIAAQAELAPGLHVSRTLVLTDDYLVDELAWTGDENHELSLPFHDVVPEPGHIGDDHSGMNAENRHHRDAGFGFITDHHRHGETHGVVRLIGAHGVRGWLGASTPLSWLIAKAPGPPDAPAARPLAVASARGMAGRMVGVWSWSRIVTDVRVGETSITIERGARGTHIHSRDGQEWVTTIDGVRSSLAGVAEVRPGWMPEAGARRNDAAPATRDILLPFSAVLGESHYRRSEQSWPEAGEPRAEITIHRIRRALIRVTVAVAPSHRLFMAHDAANPLDNEQAAINGDSVQLFVRSGERSGGWLLVPERDSATVHRLPVEGWDDEIDVDSRWAPTADGYRMIVELALPPAEATVYLDILVNETAPGRARRRGQLVLSGGAGEFVYLRGDRHHPARLLRFSLLDA